MEYATPGHVDQIDASAIVPVDGQGLPAFFAYLRTQADRNGDEETGYFAPAPRGADCFPADKEVAFTQGLHTGIGAAGWRRAWVARTRAGAIVGHVDLRGHREPYASHRCLLGMGVHHGYRRRGLGRQLLQFALERAAELGTIEWLDLQVLTVNTAAMALYRQMGFEVIAEMHDMYRFDGASFGYLLMTRQVECAAAIAEEAGESTPPAFR